MTNVLIYKSYKLKRIYVSFIHSSTELLKVWNSNVSVNWLFAIQIPTVLCFSVNLYYITFFTHHKCKSLEQEITRSFFSKWSRPQPLFFDHLPCCGYPRLSTPWIGVSFDITTVMCWQPIDKPSLCCQCGANLGMKLAI